MARLPSSATTPPARRRRPRCHPAADGSGDAAGALLRPASAEEVAPLEISFLSRADLEPWRYPTPYDYHFSGSAEKHDGAGVYFAAEIVNARARSFALVGPPPERSSRTVPHEDFLDSHRARPRLGARPHRRAARICGSERLPRGRLPARASGDVEGRGGRWGLAARPSGSIRSSGCGGGLRGRGGDRARPGRGHCLRRMGARCLSRPSRPRSRSSSGGRTRR